MGVSPFDLLDEFKRVVSFTRSWKPNMFWYDEDQGMTPINPLDALEIWYSARRGSIYGDLKYQQNKLIAERHQLKALLVVVDHPKEITELIRSHRTKLRLSKNSGNATN